MDEPAELAQLYACSYRRLVVQVAALTGDVGEAEDAVQEAFVRAAAHWSRVRRTGNPEAWLATTAANVARSRWRRLRRGLTLTFQAAQLAGPRPHDSPGPDRVAVLRALRALPVSQRETLALYYLADESVAQIAAHLNVAEGTVKARLSRGRQALAELLADEDPIGEAHDRA